MLHIRTFTFNALEENTYLLFDDTKACVIIDPGCYDREEQYELADFIESNELKVQLLLNTHCHVDHILGNYFVKEKYQVKLLIHPTEHVVLRAGKVYAPHYGFSNFQEADADGYLQAGDVVTVGNHALKVLFVPGHSPGHIAFYEASQNMVIAGDVLFYNSIGRTDLPGGDYNTLIHSIHQNLFTLPDATIVYPGHGPETSIGFEKKTNPFCALTSIR